MKKTTSLELSIRLESKKEVSKTRHGFGEFIGNEKNSGGPEYLFYSQILQVVIDKNSSETFLWKSVWQSIF